MRLRGAILTALFVMGLGSHMPMALWAQQGNPESIGILTIDQERLFTGSLFGERVVVEIKKDLAILESDFQRIEADLIAEEKDLTQKRPTLKPEVFRNLADAFDEKVQGIRRAQDAKARALDQRLEQERANFYTLVNPILRTMMADIGAAIIIDRRAILVGAEGVDITDTALQLIDSTLGDGASQSVPTDE